MRNDARRIITLLISKTKLLLVLLLLHPYENTRTKVLILYFRINLRLIFKQELVVQSILYLFALAFKFCSFFVIVIPFIQLKKIFI